MIEFKNVFLGYVSEFYSLYDCNIKIATNTLLVEKNLCGASAFMRVVSKIDKHYTGDVFIDNINLKNIKKKELPVAYLPEIPVLFKNKNAYKNLAYPLILRKINKETIKNKVNSLFSQYNLDFLDKKIKNLSLSEQKIVTLLRAIIREPKYILLENFFENFDNSYLDLATKILNDVKNKSIIIAYEKNFEKIGIFEDFVQVEI